MKDLSHHASYYIDLSVDLPPLNLKSIFNNDNEVSLEIGFGEGDFLIELARNKPNLNFVGLEIKKNRFKKALSHASRLGLMNIKFIHFDASVDLKQIFKGKCFYKIYINFPDPWPKLRHQKHRIITEELLDQLYKITTDHCYIEIASDHRDYISIIMDEFRKSGLYSLNSYLKYFGSITAPQKTTTKFESQFLKERREIYYLSYIKSEKK